MDRQALTKRTERVGSESESSSDEDMSAEAAEAAAAKEIKDIESDSEESEESDKMNFEPIVNKKPKNKEKGIVGMKFMQQSE